MCNFESVSDFSELQVHECFLPNFLTFLSFEMQGNLFKWTRKQLAHFIRKSHRFSGKININVDFESPRLTLQYAMPGAAVSFF
jgi:hypothetical protein